MIDRRTLFKMAVASPLVQVLTAAGLLREKCNTITCNMSIAFRWPDGKWNTYTVVYDNNDGRPWTEADLETARVWVKTDE